MKVKHNKLVHFPIPPMLPFQRCDNVIRGTFLFTEDSKYYLNNENQGDWNKMIGIKSGLFSQIKDGRMIVWNYDSELDKFFVTLYVHGGSDWGNTVETTGYRVGSGNAFVCHRKIECLINKTYDFSISSNYSQSILYVGDYGVSLKNKNTSSDRKYIITPWFGGQEKAKCSYTLNIHK